MQSCRWQSGVSEHGSQRSAVASTTTITKEKESWTILRKMIVYIWPKHKASLRSRVVAAFMLLIGAKVFIV